MWILNSTKYRPLICCILKCFVKFAPQHTSFCWTEPHLMGSGQFNKTFYILSIEKCTWNANPKSKKKVILLNTSESSALRSQHNSQDVLGMSGNVKEFFLGTFHGNLIPFENLKNCFRLTSRYLWRAYFRYVVDVNWLSPVWMSLGQPKT